jgi:hypothetical protein
VRKHVARFSTERDRSVRSGATCDALPCHRHYRVAPERAPCRAATRFAPRTRMRKPGTAMMLGMEKTNAENKAPQRALTDGNMLPAAIPRQPEGTPRRRRRRGCARLRAVLRRSGAKAQAPPQMRSDASARLRAARSTAVVLPTMIVPWFELRPVSIIALLGSDGHYCATLC